MSVSFKQQLKISGHLDLVIDNFRFIIKAFQSGRLLGIYFDARLNFTSHILTVQVKANRALNILKFSSGIRYYFINPMLDRFIIIILLYIFYIPTVKISPNLKESNTQRFDWLQATELVPRQILSCLNPKKKALKTEAINQANKACLTKILSKKSSLTYKTIKNLSTEIKQDKRKRGLIINECVNEAMKYETENLTSTFTCFQIW